MSQSEWSEVLGANLALDEDIAEKEENDFSWLDAIDQDHCYMPLDLTRPSKTLDFGSGGYTGSISTWHELLQLTAPDDECGVVFVRGDFPDSPESILSRAQRRNQKGTFGLGINIGKDIKYVLERTPAQGMINLRWPCTRLNFVHPDPSLGAASFASHTMCSFIKDGTLYQILRIAPSGLPSPAPSVNDGETGSAMSISKLRVDIGGTLRFGCASTNVSKPGPPIPFLDNYTEEKPENGGPVNVLAYSSSRHERRLEIRLWVNRDAIQLDRDDSEESRLHRPRPESQAQYKHETCRPRALYSITVPTEKALNIVASFSFPKKSTPICFHALDPPSSTDIQDYLGVTEKSLSAPYRLWSSILNQPSGPEAVKLNVVGRCMEGVLGLSCVPVVQRSGHDEARDGTERDMGIALVKNIIAPQVVDLKSTFWQVRFLVKAAKILDRPILPNHFEAEPAVKAKRDNDMRDLHRKSLIVVLRGLCRWILHIVPNIASWNLQNPSLGLLSSDVIPHASSRRDCKPPKGAFLPNRDQSKLSRQLESRRFRSQRWYCSMIIWYVLNQLPETFNDEDIREAVWDQLPAFDSIESGDNDIGTVAVDDSYGCMLRWYHSYSFAKICDWRREADSGRFGKSGIDLRRHIKLATNWQVKSEKSLRLFSQGRLINETLSHKVANLTLVGSELGIAQGPLSLQSSSCLQYARELIGKRCETKELCAGRPRVVRWDALHDVRSAEPRPAPWEMSCLGHHIPLSLRVTQNEDAHWDECQNFLQSDYTFMDSWDQSAASIVGRWWDWTTSSIVCAQILDDHMDRRQQSWGDILDTGEPLKRKSTFNKIAQAKGAEAGLPGSNVITGLAVGRRITRNDSDQPEPEKSDLRRIFELLQEHFKGTPPQDSDGLDWKKRQPRGLYHADTGVQSLEDTPMVFNLQQPRSVEVRRNVDEYFKKNALPEPKWDLVNVYEQITAENMRHVSCFDLSLQADGNDLPEIIIASSRGRVQMPHLLETEFSSKCPTIGVALKEADDPGLWDLYFMGKLKHVRIAGLKEPLKELLQDARTRANILKKYQRSLFCVLNDSLVDLGTKYRILFVKRPSPTIYQALIYMWHPDALDTFDDHLGARSRYLESTIQSPNGGEDLWIHSITISHWRLQSDLDSEICQLEETEEKKEREKRVEQLQHQAKVDAELQDDASAPGVGITTKFPPVTVVDKRSKKIVQDGRHIKLSTIRELSLSVVFTGDTMGRYWTCTIISELFDDVEVAGYTQEMGEIMQMFIHQQYSGRLLAFLILLGYFCATLAKECENFMEELDKIMGMNPMVLLTGMEWHKSDAALKKLKQMLWGLEALRVFDDKLKKAIQEIENGNTGINNGLKQGAELRHKDMKRSIEKVREEFQKRYTRLKNAHDSINDRIAQGTKLREGITSVLGVEQNENISMLTWVTIAYLPVSFIATVFTIGHGIIPDRAGWPTFGWLLTTFFCGTIIFALGLQFILSRLRRAEKWGRGVFGKAREKVGLGVAGSVPGHGDSTLMAKLRVPAKFMELTNRKWARKRDVEAGFEE